jgi:predicted small secreted protein
MRTISIAAVAMAAVALLTGCVIVTGIGPDVSLHAATQSVLSGEIVVLQADALDPRGGGLSYEWSEDSVVLDASSSSVAYSKFVAVTSTMSVRVKVTDSYGSWAMSTIKITVVPPFNPGTITVRNRSPFKVYYLHVSMVGANDWGPDQLRPDTIVFPGYNVTLPGVPAGSWDILAYGYGKVPQWQNVVTVYPSQAAALDLY